MPVKTPDLAWIPRFGYASRLCFCATCTPASRLTRADARFRIRGRPIVTTKSALVIAALVTALAPVPSLYAATQGNTLANLYPQAAVLLGMDLLLILASMRSFRRRLE